MKQPLLALITLSLAACSAQKEQLATSPAPPSEPVVVGGRFPAHRQPPVNAVAMTKIYKTNGDYADRVPVTLNSQGNGLISYPAPSDVAGAFPIKLIDGYLLDRRGVSAATAFTRWTYEEYAALPSAPDVKTIMANLIPGARVTEIRQMPFPTGTDDAVARCDSLISAGFPGCETVYMAIERKR